eukprot:Polyplicarium_translucidae@DN1443_c0_g1_i1.p1
MREAQQTHGTMRPDESCNLTSSKFDTVAAYQPQYPSFGQKTQPEKKMPRANRNADAENRERGVMDAIGGLGGAQEVMGKLRKELEGPYPIRVICGLCGLAMFVSCGFGMLNIFSLIAQPARFILRAYMMAFSLIIMIVELKDVPCIGAKLQEFTHKWLPFLTIIGGKGSFYAFAGSLGASSLDNIIVFIPAMAVMVCGVVLILIHFGKCKQLSDKYDQTIKLESGTLPPMTQ